ncbi:hypothetical protein DMZ43_12700 [Meridianimaribacter sp. CL38]|uniref:hypothetical protein n=1 Tax=Meridianimaribacter sp. CL38 TaxID=2213021 RepID=UPI001039F154|nr:hypothetical protein [Meridianimaribacter sp. CL38]TBV25164.1 hypothetical protein DMZ43_12700 [Meridianimaribacter sp. CL38]
MTNNIIHTIINQLKEGNSKEKAYLGFFQYGRDIDESCIKANKEGLLLYASYLLEAGLEINKRSFDKNKIETFALSPDFISENTDFDFHYIELLNKPRLEIESISEYKESWKDKLVGYVIGGFLISLIVLIIIGFITILKWIF